MLPLPIWEIERPSSRPQALLPDPGQHATRRASPETRIGAFIGKMNSNNIDNIIAFIAIISHERFE
jgi:hypothetical protein